ncbi:MAG: hypothetical protein KGS61_07950 [Verrucomicrobia bacterium]|nr:hypothetical protein [Verrucomicrobiota bacterium]
MKSKLRPRAAEPAVLKDATGLGAPPPTSPAALPMHRTQIYLSREEFEFVQGEATRRGEPMAAVIRSLIDERMQVPAEVWEQNPLLASPADPGFVGPADGAINHDHYVHGTPRRWIKRRGRWLEAPPLPADYYTNPASAAAYDRKMEQGR